MENIKYQLEVVCLVGLAIHVAVLVGWYALRVLRPLWTWIRQNGVQAAVIAPFVIGVSLVGMTKNTGSVTYPYTDIETRYLVDAGSYVTNDYVHVSFTRSIIVPDSANLYGSVRPVGSTNDEDWVEILATTFAAFQCPSNIPFAGAHTNNFVFYTDFTPGPVVHTNGVAVVNWQRDFDGGSNNLATIRTGIYVGGSRVAPNPAITNGPPVIMLNLTNGENENE